MDEKRTIADSLDPAQYASHVTRTALLLEQLARDVSALRDETERSIQGSNGLRTAITNIERENAVFKEAITGRVGINEVAIHDLTERLKWLGRLVVGALLTGAISGVVAIIFKALGKL